MIRRKAAYLILNNEDFQMRSPVTAFHWLFDRGTNPLTSHKKMHAYRQETIPWLFLSVPSGVLKSVLYFGFFFCFFFFNAVQ